MLVEMLEKARPTAGLLFGSSDDTLAQATLASPVVSRFRTAQVFAG